MDPTRDARSRPFVEVDVFAAPSAPYSGNPLAVVLDGADLAADELQRFANWTNFSETTFVLPPTDPAADYAVRIFTATTELPFAGHPTLGTCHAWLEAGGVPRRPDRIVQECGVGLVTIARDAAGRLAFAAPPLLREGPLDDVTLAAACTALGIDRSAVVDAAWVDNGPGWLAVLLDSGEAVLDLSCTDTELKIGVVGPYPTDADAAYEVRAFFPANGRTFEDPVTGSLNASVAQWMVATDRVTTPYTARQGRALGRDGRVSVTRADGELWIGGDVVTCVAGTVVL